VAPLGAARGLSRAIARDAQFASMNEGPLSSPLLRWDGAWLRRCRPTAWMPAELRDGWAALWRASGSVMVWSSAHVSIASSNFEDQVLSGLAPAAQVKNGLSGSQANYGAFRSEGLERLVAGQHVPDRLRQLASELDLGDFRAALAAEAALGALVALLIERV
jgi:hypothetical protein